MKARNKRLGKVGSQIIHSQSVHSLQVDGFNNTWLDFFNNVSQWPSPAQYDDLLAQVKATAKNEDDLSHWDLTRLHQAFSQMRTRHRQKQMIESGKIHSIHGEKLAQLQTTFNETPLPTTQDIESWATTLKVPVTEVQNWVTVQHSHKFPPPPPSQLQVSHSPSSSSMPDFELESPTVKPEQQSPTIPAVPSTFISSVGVQVRWYLSIFLMFIPGTTPIPL